MKLETGLRTFFECVWRLGMNYMCMIFVKNQHAPPQWVISVFVFDWSLFIPILCRKFSVHLWSISSVVKYFAKVFYKLKSTESKTFKYSFHQNHVIIFLKHNSSCFSFLLLIFLLNLYRIYLRHTNQSLHFLPLKMTLFSSKNEIKVILQHWLICNTVWFDIMFQKWKLSCCEKRRTG